MLITIEAVFTETLRASMSEIVKIDIDKPIAFVHFTLRAADDIDGAPGCIPKAIYAVQDRFLQLLQVPAMEFDSVFVMDLSVFQLIKCTEAVFCNKQRFLPPVPEYVQIVPQADRVDSPIVSGPFQPGYRPRKRMSPKKNWSIWLRWTAAMASSGLQVAP